MDKLWGPHDLSAAYEQHFQQVIQSCSGRIKIIDANQSIESVKAQIVQAVEEIKEHMHSTPFSPGAYSFLDKYTATEIFYK